MNTASGNLQQTASNPADHVRPWRRRVFWALMFLALCALLAAAVRLMLKAGSAATIQFDQLMAYGSFVAVAAAAPLVLALLRRRLAMPLHNTDSGQRLRMLSPVIACTVLSIAISAAAWATYQLGSGFVVRAADSRLQAVVTLKTHVIDAWLDDVRDDIRLSVESPQFYKAVSDWRNASPTDDSGRQRLVEFLWRLSKTSHYVEISLRDPGTGTLLLTTSGDEDSPEVRRQAMAAAQAPLPVLEDFHTDAGSKGGNVLYLGCFTAITPPDGPRLVIHVGIDPRHELFPLIGHWPGTTGTAEVLLLRREGDSMLVLNDMHDRQDAPARRLATQPERSIAAALALGKTGILRGDDDGGASVLAYALPVKGTPWVLMAKLDEDEVFAELNRTTLLAASIIGALLLLGAWWWVERHRHVRVEQQHRIERTESAQRLTDLSRRVVSVQEAERQHWSSELHDRTAANLAAINLNLKAIERALPSPGAEDKELLQETSDLLADTVASIREFCGVLRPAVLDYAGLVAAVETSVAQFSRRTGVQAHFDHAGLVGRCSKELESVLFRIAQEALMNCTKHAQATKVLITLSGSAQRPVLRIEDNGMGFELDSLCQPGRGIGQGLLNMRERAAFVGATLTIDSAPGRGTRIVVEL